MRVPTARIVVAAIVLSLAAASCSESSPAAVGETPSFEPTATPVTASPTVEAAAPAPTNVAPTPTTPPAAIDERDLIRAAIDAFEAAPGDLVAFDVIDSQIRSSGLVDVTVCGWDGEGVYDEVRQVLVEVVGNDAASLTAEIVGSSLTAGSCLSEALAESALEFAGEWENRYRAVLEAPSTIDDDPWLEQVMDAESYFFLRDRAQAWSGDGVHIENSYYDGTLPGPLEAEFVWRRFGTADDAIFSFVVCRVMDEGYGLYSDEGGLIDALRADAVGPHSVVEYRLRRVAADPSIPNDDGWRLARTSALVWSDCTDSPDWAASVTVWSPDPIPFEALSE